MHNSEKLKLTLMYISIHTSVNCQKSFLSKLKHITFTILRWISLEGYIEINYGFKSKGLVKCFFFNAIQMWWKFTTRLFKYFKNWMQLHISKAVHYMLSDGKISYTKPSKLHIYICMYSVAK